jgi:PAS domain S-box-containing protein
MKSHRPSFNQGAATILNVDDSEAGRYVKSRILSAAGYRVIEAATGTDALRLAREAKPHLALLDVKLPDLNGLEVCRSLKGDSATASIMVVLISALAVRREDKVTGLQEGADGYLVEPVEPDELLATVRALLRLYHSEQRLQLALKATNDVVWEWDAVNDVEIWNQAGVDLFGWTDIVEKPQPAAWWVERIHPDDRQRVVDGFHDVLNDSTAFHWEDEYRFCKADDEYASIMDRGYVIRNDEGRAIRMIGAMQDMTDRVRHEAMLRESKERYRHLVGILPVAIYSCDREGRITFYNEKAVELWGYAPKIGNEHEKFSEAFTLFLSGGSPMPHARMLIEESIRNGTSYRGQEVVIERPDSSCCHVLTNIDPIKAIDGMITGAIIVFTDITERKRTEEALSESQDRLQRTMESLALAQRASLSGVWDWNMTTGDVYVSREYRRLFGFSDDEPVTFDRWLAAVHEDDRPTMEADSRRLFESGTDWKVEFRIMHPQLGIRWLAGIGRLERNVAGRARRFSGVNLDITERKQSERWTQLLATEAIAATAKFRAVFDQSAIFAGIMSLDGTLLEANRSCLDVCGYRAEEVMRRPFWETPWWCGSQDVQAELREAATRAAQGAVYRKELPYWRADGTERLVDFTLHPIRDEEGRVIFLHPTGVDITELKRRESNLAFLADVQEVFSRLSSTDEIMRAVTEKIVAYLRLSRCFLVGIDEGSQHAHVLYDHADVDGPSLAGRCPIAAFHTESEQRLLAGGRTLVIDDVTQEPRSEEAAALFAELEVGAITNAPYVSNDRWTFVLSAVHRAPHRWRTDEVELLTELASRIYVRVERARAEEALLSRERQLKLITDTVPLYIAHCDRGGRYLFVNHGYAEGFGLQPEDCVGKKIAEIVGEETYARVHTYVETALAGEPVEFEVEVPDAEMGPRHMRCHYVPERRFDGSVQGLVAVISDITTRVTMEAALRASEERYRKVFEYAAMGVVITDLQERFIQCNPAFCALLGYTQEELSRMGFSSLVYPDDRAANLVEIRRVMEEELPFFEIENRYVHQNGQPVWVHKFVSLLRDDKDTPAYLVTLVTDVTERRQLEMSLRESQERLRVFAQELETRVEERTQELVQSQQQLRALATELNLAEQRERKRLAGELHDYLAQLLVLGRLKLGQVRRSGLPSKADETVKETEEVLNQALNYSRTLMAELSPPVLQEHGLSAGLKWLGEQMRRHGLMVRVEVGDASSVILPEECTVLLFQSVRELLMNVLKHADSHKVVVRIQQGERRLRIEVQDHGVGFDLAVLAGSAPTTISSKFGLLSIRERMTALGGWLDLQSTPGEGTTATLVLPLTSTDEVGPDVKVLSVKLGTNSDRNTYHATHGQRDTNLRVLLVDDHAMVRQGLRSVLESYPDIEVVGEAWNGEVAVATVDALHPTIVLMDINMPRMNGIEATATIKARHPEIIVIGLSVNTGGENEMAMKHAGAAMLLTKEAAVDELYRTIQDVLGRRTITGG